ncbi:MAG: ABC-2 family transporter protein [Clostridia bacterium]|nr:ABC-2 family transporter protein [Clostridia bacterium]
MNTLKLYAKSMAMLIKSQLQYPLSFPVQTLAQLIMEGGEFMAVLLLVDRFDRLNQWTAGDLYFFFGIMSVTFYITEFLGRGVTGEFPRLVRSGQLDTLLVRPRGLLTQVLCSAVDPRRIACVAVGTAALAIGCRLSAVRWTLVKALLFIESVAFGAALVLGLFLVEAVFCVYSVKSVELVNVLTYGGRSACQYPIDIYARPLRVLFTVAAPFALVLHVPAAYILGKPLYGWPAWAAFLCPLSGALLFGVTYALFRRALRHYRSTGS